MEAAATTSLSTIVADVIELIMTSMSSIATSLMSNVLFQYVLGIIFFSIAIGVVYGLVRKLKRRGK